MKDKITKLVALFVLLVCMSSCFEGTWRRYDHRSHYLHKRHFHRYHRNKGWN